MVCRVGDMMKPKKGAVALCSLGSLGLITENEPQEVVYPDGMAWVGVHLTDKIAPIGSKWSSRNPIIINDNIQELIK